MVYLFLKLKKETPMTVGERKAHRAALGTVIYCLRVDSSWLNQYFKGIEAFFLKEKRKIEQSAARIKIKNYHHHVYTPPHTHATHMSAASNYRTCISSSDIPLCVSCPPTALLHSFHFCSIPLLDFFDLFAFPSSFFSVSLFLLFHLIPVLPPVSSKELLFPCVCYQYCCSTKSNKGEHTKSESFAIRRIERLLVFMFFMFPVFLMFIMMFFLMKSLRL